jgi:hypothetical protein
VLPANDDLLVDAQEPTETSRDTPSSRRHPGLAVGGSSITLPQHHATRLADHPHAPKSHRAGNSVVPRMQRVRPAAPGHGRRAGCSAHELRIRKRCRDGGPIGRRKRSDLGRHRPRHRRGDRRGRVVRLRFVSRAGAVFACADPASCGRTPTGVNRPDRARQRRAQSPRSAAASRSLIGDVRPTATRAQ